MRKKGFIQTAVPYVILLTIALCFLLPLIWLFFTAFNPQATATFTIPKEVSLENFRQVVNKPYHLKSFLNSLIISVSQVIIVLVLAIVAAYPLSRYGLKNAQRIAFTCLFFTSIPIVGLMIPVYQIFIAFRMIDSRLGIVLFLATTALPYGIWMMKNFLDSVPVELEESAWVDGASVFKSLWYVLIPLMVPGLFTVAIFTFIGSWSNFFVPFILLQSIDKIPASVNIYRFIGERGEVHYGQIAAYSLIYVLPVFIMYSFSQNYMSKGFSMSGSTKG